MEFSGMDDPFRMAAYILWYDKHVVDDARYNFSKTFVYVLLVEISSARWSGFTVCYLLKINFKPKGSFI